MEKLKRNSERLKTRSCSTKAPSRWVERGNLKAQAQSKFNGETEMFGSGFSSRYVRCDRVCFLFSRVFPTRDLWIFIFFILSSVVGELYDCFLIKDKYKQLKRLGFKKFKLNLTLQYCSVMI